VTLAVAWCRSTERGAAAAVVKDAGDDPDATDGVQVVVAVEPLPPLSRSDLEFAAGEGVGTVTKRGLQVPVDEPAINPVPRRMIREAVRGVTGRPLRIVVSIPGGEEIARRTFNPRLGVVGGLSVLGTTGIVRPFSHEAIQETVRCSLDVALACGVACPVLVPGHVGERAARDLFDVSEHQVVEVSNEWGIAVDSAAARGFSRCLALGHPGKLAKLAMGSFDTHSSRSESPVAFVRRLVCEYAETVPSPIDTVEGVFQELAPSDRRRVAGALAVQVRVALEERAGRPFAAALVNMRGALLGFAGDVSPWRPRESSF
jgi:cobalt-precorrin-5B (C1)-methyltransferase